MTGLGSGDSGEWTFLDIVTLISFCIALQNLELNISQDDLQKQAETLDTSLRKNVEEIHLHLEEQDNKLNKILEAIRNDS